MNKIQQKFNKYQLNQQIGHDQQKKILVQNEFMYEIIENSPWFL